MSLQELKQEYERQQAEPVRFFSRTTDLLAYIEDNKPLKLDKVTLNMCVLLVEDHEKCWHISMISKSDEDDFEQRKALVNKLDDDKRTKFVFCLTLWKSKKQSRDHVVGRDFTPGQSYVFQNVCDLHLYMGVAQGSLQAKNVAKPVCEKPRKSQKLKLKSTRAAKELENTTADDEDDNDDNDDDK